MTGHLRLDVSEPIYEAVVICGILDLLEMRPSLSPDDAGSLRFMLQAFDNTDLVSSLELAIGFLEPGPEQDIREAIYWLVDHLHDEERGFLSTEERFAVEHAVRDEINDFSRSLGEEPDPDRPFEFPTMDPPRDPPL